MAQVILHFTQQQQGRFSFWSAPEIPDLIIAGLSEKDVREHLVMLLELYYSRQGKNVRLVSRQDSYTVEVT